MSSNVIKPEDVLASLMNDGTIDAIRAKIINQLKANAREFASELRASTKASRNSTVWLEASTGPTTTNSVDTSNVSEAYSKMLTISIPLLVDEEELKNTTISMVEQSKVLNTPDAEKQTKRELFDALRKELEAPVLEKASKAVWEVILDENGLGKEISDIVEMVFRRLSGLEVATPSAQTAIVAQPYENKETEGSEKLTEEEKPKSRKRSFEETCTHSGAETVANDSTDQLAAASDNDAPSGT